MCQKAKKSHYTKEQLKEINRIARRLYQVISLADTITDFWKVHGGKNMEHLEMNSFEAMLLALNFSSEGIYNEFDDLGKLMGHPDFGAYLDSDNSRQEKWMSHEEHMNNRFCDPAKKHLEIASVMKF